MSDIHVLDASALLAALHDGPGADRIRDILPKARICSVNLSEVIATLHAHGVPDAMIDEIVDDLDLMVVPFDLATAKAAGLLHTTTRAAGLSLGDRACLALAVGLGAVAVTADRGWEQLDLGIAIEVIG